MEIKVNGATELVKKLDKIADPQRLEQIIGDACALVERSAKEKAPKRTGELRRSIESKVETDTNSVVGTVFTPLEYAPYVEYGTGLFAESGGRKDVPWNYQDDKGEWHSTSGQDPHPYMRPALDENREDIMSMIEGAILDV